MRVLLTGSAGFIATAIGRRLEARGDAVGRVDPVVRVDLMLARAHGGTEPGLEGCRFLVRLPLRVELAV